MHPKRGKQRRTGLQADEIFFLLLFVPAGSVSSDTRSERRTPPLPACQADTLSAPCHLGQPETTEMALCKFQAAIITFLEKGFKLNNFDKTNLTFPVDSL